MIGPFKDERAARMAALAATGPDEDPRTDAGNRSLLTRTLAAAGVEMGAYDERIADWLARWEPATCITIAGWISRAAKREGES